MVNKTTPYGISLEELADFSSDLMESVSSLLVICNTKESARKLYNTLKTRREYKLCHLSTAMCPAHRTDTLEQINAALHSKEKLLCVSTQLVEAGVDFSFESVVRVAAGLDNIAQAAGRCNRGFEFDNICRVYVVNLRQDAERLSMLREIAAAQRCAAWLLRQFFQQPALYADNLLSDQSMAAYYRRLFDDPDIKGKFAFPKKLPDGQIENLSDLLAENKTHLERPEIKGRYCLNQAFKTAGEAFEVFDENTVEVIVPYNAQADALIADLFSQKADFDYGFLKSCIEKARPYTVHLFRYQYQTLLEYGMLSFPKDKENKARFTVLNKQCYHPETGVNTEAFIF